MSDLRSFLRFLFPAIVFFGEFALLLFAGGGLADLRQFFDWASQAGLGGSTVLAGGLAALGALLATLHHTLYWICHGYRAANLQASIRSLHEQGLLDKWLPGFVVDRPEMLDDPRRAWRLHTTIWHLHRTSVAQLDSATARVEGMTDLMHGAGTALVASASAVVLMLPYLAQTRTGLDLRISVLFTTVAGLALVWLHWRSYRELGLHLQVIANTALVAALNDASRPGASHCHPDGRA